MWASSIFQACSSISWLSWTTSSRRSSPSLMRSICRSRVAVIALDEMSTGAFSMAASNAAMSAMPSSVGSTGLSRT